MEVQQYNTDSSRLVWVVCDVRARRKGDRRCLGVERWKAALVVELCVLCRCVFFLSVHHSFLPTSGSILAQELRGRCMFRACGFPCTKRCHLFPPPFFPAVA